MAELCSSAPSPLSITLKFLPLSVFIFIHVFCVHFFAFKEPEHRTTVLEFSWFFGSPL